MPDINENAETQQEYFGVHTDNKETLQNAVKRIKELEQEKQGLKDYCDKYAKTILSLRQNIAELEAQIKKMKCCGNCKHYQFQNDAGYYTCTRDGKRNGKNYRSCEFNLEKWEGR